MPLEMIAIPCLRDNYAYLLYDPETGRTGVVDVPDVAPIHAVLDAKGYRLSDIFITHHHDDHIGGVMRLREDTGAAVWGARADAHRLPPLDHALDEGDSVTLGAAQGRVIEVSGHTVGHIAFHFPESRLAFTADSLMALGCGRLFEGSAAQMWESLCKLMALPDETLICSGHDYSAGNAAFALHVDPENADLKARVAGFDADRAAGRPMAVVPLGLEKATNPFLRAGQHYLKQAHGRESASDAEMFAYLRDLKDTF
ncbi:hydroxyacylglutathione hydrolase [Natronohydrobacter thiooxidans]|uniref:hydroxyacylglutathione hydrolase n=1 Tax=Natronohydrobacter thiooxidans TaxID=87172 RepID=UPI0008FF3120|nr:hydroxyacylglutathione hydrolase [Natronohydrobacter thiooxidans]